MKKLLLISILLCSAQSLFAQAPQQFSFQGVARDAAGKVIANTTVSLRLTIHKEIPLGTSVYQEVHTPQTSSSGIFTVFVGGGANQTGTFDEIKWESSSHFLQVEIDPTGGPNFVNLGSTQLMSVPYALHAGQADKWKDGDPVVQRGIDKIGGVLPQIGKGPRLIWYPKESAFRAGSNEYDAWEPNKIGSYSSAFGYGAEASGTVSIAFGDHTKASGFGSFAHGVRAIASNDYTFAQGWEAKAQGSHSVAFGESTLAEGTNSTATGEDTKASGQGSFSGGRWSHSEGNFSFTAGTHTIARAFGGTSIGRYNDNQDSPDHSVGKPTDRLFQIGIGFNGIARHNAMTVLGNGYVGIGNNVLEPKYIMDIGARPRIRHNPNSPNGITAGIYFDDSKGNPEGFVGFKKDDEIGFYHANKWAFWMDNLGNAHIIGSNYNTSDRRLKQNFSSLSNSLSKLSDLNGYNYFWKDNTLDQSIQTGLIAQDVEAIFPELVKTDEKGFKSVNYTGLIPHLIESVKELDKKYQAVQVENEALKNVLKRVDILEAALNKLTSDGAVSAATNSK